MGYLLFETEEKGFSVVMDELKEKLESAGSDADGNTTIEINIKGKTSQTLSFKSKGTGEIVEILKLNSD